MVKLREMLLIIVVVVAVMWRSIGVKILMVRMMTSLLIVTLPIRWNLLSILRILISLSTRALRLLGWVWVHVILIARMIPGLIWLEFFFLFPCSLLLVMLMPTMCIRMSLLGLPVSSLLATTKWILKSIIDYFVRLHIFERVWMAV